MIKLTYNKIQNNQGQYTDGRIDTTLVRFRVRNMFNTDMRTLDFMHDASLLGTQMLREKVSSTVAANIKH